MYWGFEIFLIYMFSDKLSIICHRFIFFYLFEPIQVGELNGWNVIGWKVWWIHTYKEMDKTEKEEFQKLCLDTPPKLKDVQKEVIKKTFYSKRNKKIYGKPEKILKIFNILEANAYCICNSTYLALQSARINHSCRPNAQRTQFRKVNTTYITFLSIRRKPRQLSTLSSLL